MGPKKILAAAQQTESYDDCVSALRLLVSRYPKEADRLGAWQDLWQIEAAGDPEAGLKNYLNYLTYLHLTSPDQYSKDQMNTLVTLYESAGHWKDAEFLLEKGQPHLSNAGWALRRHLSDILLKEGEFEKALSIEPSENRRDSIRAWLDTHPNQELEGQGILGFPGDLRERPHRGMKLWIYVNPVTSRSPAGEMAKAASHQNSGYYVKWVDDINHVFRYFSHDQFDLAEPEVRFEPLHTPTGKITNDIDVLTSKEVLEHRDQGLILLIGFGDVGTGDYAGHGVMFLDWRGSRGAKTAGVHEILHALGMQHSTSVPRYYRLNNVSKEYIEEPQQFEDRGNREPSTNYTIGLRPWTWHEMERRYAWHPVPTVPLDPLGTMENSLNNQLQHPQKLKTPRNLKHAA